MPIPAIVGGAVYVAAGGAMAAKLAGDLLLRKAKANEKAAHVYTQNMQAKYEAERKLFIERMRTYHTHITIFTKSNTNISFDATEMPDKLKDAWELIRNATLVSHPFPGGTFPVFGQSVPSFNAMKAANQLDRLGHPMVAGVVRTAVAAKAGVTYFDACLTHKSNVDTKVQRYKIESDQIFVALIKEVSDIESSWNNFVTPTMQRAMQSDDKELIHHLQIWADLLLGKIMEFSNAS